MLHLCSLHRMHSTPHTPHTLHTTPHSSRIHTIMHTSCPSHTSRTPHHSAHLAHFPPLRTPHSFHTTPHTSYIPHHSTQLRTPLSQLNHKSWPLWTPLQLFVSGLSCNCTVWRLVLPCLLLCGDVTGQQ